MRRKLLVPLRLAVIVTVVAALQGCATLPLVVRDTRDPAVGELVSLRALDSGLRFDIRYATSNNFTGRQLYPIPGAWLRRDAARALLAVQRDLQRQHLGLKIYDAYRPYSVQQAMWNLIRDERYVSNPAKNAGRHTRGTAVDVTLVDSNGRELEMPTAFDDFTERARRGAPGISAEARRHSDLLERTMVRHGFIPFKYEWWHFDFAGWEQHPPLDVPIDLLANRSQTHASR